MKPEEDDDVEEGPLRKVQQTQTDGWSDNTRPHSGTCTTRRRTQTVWVQTAPHSHQLVPSHGVSLLSDFVIHRGSYSYEECGSNSYCIVNGLLSCYGPTPRKQRRNQSGICAHSLRRPRFWKRLCCLGHSKCQCCLCRSQ